jgi:hypothetical protein
VLKSRWECSEEEECSSKNWYTHLNKHKKCCFLLMKGQAVQKLVHSGGIKGRVKMLALIFLQTIFEKAIFSGQCGYLSLLPICIWPIWLMADVQTCTYMNIADCKSFFLCNTNVNFQTQVGDFVHEERLKI